MSTFAVDVVFAVAGGYPRPLYVVRGHLECPDDYFCWNIDYYGYPQRQLTSRSRDQMRCNAANEQVTKKETPEMSESPFPGSWVGW